MIQFSPNLVTHVDEIDNQHKELFNRINAVTSLGAGSVNRDETEKTLNLLGLYIIKHFADEEVLQRKSGYPKYKWHHEQHGEYISEFQDLKKEYQKNGASTEFTLRMNKSMVDWIVKHIKNVDVEFCKYISGKAI